MCSTVVNPAVEEGGGWTTWNVLMSFCFYINMDSGVSSTEFGAGEGR